MLAKLAAPFIKHNIPSIFTKTNMLKIYALFIDRLKNNVLMIKI